MANTKIIDRTGKGSALAGTEYDANLDSVNGVNEAQTGATHTIDVNDQNKTIEYSRATAIAVTLPAIADVSGSNITTSNFKVILKNIGVGVVTVTRSSTDTFEDTSTSITLTQYDCVIIQTDSTGAIWNIINPRTAGRFLIESQTASSSASIEFVTNINSSYKYYEIEIIEVVPASTSILKFAYSINAGSSWETSKAISGSISGTATNGGASGHLIIYNPSSSNKTIGRSEVIDASPSFQSNYLLSATTTAVDGFQFIMTSGNIASGLFKLYGII